MTYTFIEPIIKRNQVYIRDKMKNIKILIVDDDPYSILSLSMLLEMFKPRFKSFELRKANDAQEGLKICENIFKNKQPFFNIIFTDLNMPEIDGFEFIEKARNLM